MIFLDAREADDKIAVPTSKANQEIGRFLVPRSDLAMSLIETRRGSEGLTQGLPVDALERIFTLGFALDQMRQDLRDLDRCASEIARRR